VSIRNGGILWNKARARGRNLGLKSQAFTRHCFAIHERRRCLTADLRLTFDLAVPEDGSVLRSLANGVAADRSNEPVAKRRQSIASDASPRNNGDPQPQSREATTGVEASSAHHGIEFDERYVFEMEFSG